MSLLAFWLMAGVDVSALSACRALTDDIQRLRCYDRIADAQTTTSAAMTAPRPPALAVAQPTPVPAPVSVPAPKLETPQAAESTQFGLENRHAENAVERIESHVDGAVKGWNRGTRFTLANGQVWEVQDSGETAYNLQSPRVTIERGMMGGFFLKFEGANRRPRVKRIQ